MLSTADTAVARNADRAALTSEYQTRQHMMSHELQQLNKSHRTEVCHSMFCNQLVCSVSVNGIYLRLCSGFFRVIPNIVYLKLLFWHYFCIV